MNEPTADDLSRDLAADLQLATSSNHRPFPLDNDGGNYYFPPKETDWVNVARFGWPVAIRRATFAEAEVKRLRGIIGGLSDRVAAQAELLSEKAERENP